MKRLIPIVGCLAIAALLAAPAAMAAQTTTWLPAVQAASTKGMYTRPNIPVSPDPAPMHGMKSRDHGSAFAPPTAKSGPMAMGNDLRAPRAGLVTPTGGGPMYSPKEQGDREITRLIRQLG